MMVREMYVGSLCHDRYVDKFFLVLERRPSRHVNVIQLTKLWFEGFDDEKMITTTCEWSSFFNDIDVTLIWPKEQDR